MLPDLPATAVDFLIQMLSRIPEVQLIVVFMVESLIIGFIELALKQDKKVGIARLFFCYWQVNVFVSGLFVWLLYLFCLPCIWPDWLVLMPGQRNPICVERFTFCCL